MDRASKSQSCYCPLPATQVVQDKHTPIQGQTNTSSRLITTKRFVNLAHKCPEGQQVRDVMSHGYHLNIVQQKRDTYMYSHKTSLTHITSTLLIWQSSRPTRSKQHLTAAEFSDERTKSRPCPSTTLPLHNPAPAPVQPRPCPSTTPPLHNPGPTPAQPRLSPSFLMNLLTQNMQHKQTR